MNKQIYDVNNFEARATIAEAKRIREGSGGTIFAIPIEKDNPFSLYAIVTYNNPAFRIQLFPLYSR